MVQIQRNTEILRLRLRMKALNGWWLYSSLTVKSTTGVILLLNLLK